MLNWFKSKSLEDHLNQTKKVKVHGIKFTIRKMTVEHYLDGSKVMRSIYDTYTIGNKDINLDDPSLVKRVKDHWKDVFSASVVVPKIKRKQEDEGDILVDNLFTDWDLASELYSQIMLFTYGKKKA